jgi:tRNA uridine 5-carboxymethylaminomethyl modification enzyme
MKYDVIVVGGGHAGCEAAGICAKKGHHTAMILMNLKNIADMPCNPSIGGTAKGVIVREIDALGGLMGFVADRSHFQIKMLNSSKGPAVQALRCQADKITYPKEMLKELKKLPKLDIIEGMVENIIVEDKKIKGVILEDGTKYYADAVILTTGTYLRGSILCGSEKHPGGPHGERRCSYLSEHLKENGLTLQRLKTGTPQRIAASSIDFSKMHPEVGDDHYWTFSHDYPPQYKINKQQKCYLIYTTPLTKKIIQDNLSKSSMYGGYVEGIGPRYCPSIEDKIVRFKDKERHQLFLEPESLYYDDWYLQGFSTSMPHDIQDEMVHSLPGLEHAFINKYAYAIEYDAIDPLQMKPSLESKVIDGLFTAGQINGTSGYEEAAGQGLIAGINASLKLEHQEPLILKRSDAYIGVLIDDLVTKGTIEPYRMLTSRAEFRLILRHDNADLRLRPIAHKIGTISEEQYQRLLDHIKDIDSLTALIKQTKIKITPEIKAKFIANNLDVPKETMSIYHLLKRPEITIEFINSIYPLNYPENALEQVEIATKYEGYIVKTNKEIAKLLKLESKQIPLDINYDLVTNLASEAKQKLKKVRPQTIAQAIRISGVNPADIAILTVYLRKEYPNNEHK